MRHKERQQRQSLKRLIIIIMTAEITMNQLYFNTSLLSFFMRDQAIKMLEDVVHSFDSVEEALNAIEMAFDDVDEFEEVLYNEELPDILEMLA